MTAIVAVVENGKVFMGADSCGMDPWHNVMIVSDSKVFRNGEFLIGYTSSFRMGQILQFAFTPPEPAARIEHMRYMVGSFVPELRKTLREHGCLVSENGKDTAGSFLVGWQGCIFEIQEEFQVMRSISPYQAVGCGANFALGVLYATCGLNAGRRILLALESAAHFSGGVRGPFRYLSN